MASPSPRPKFLVQAQHSPALKIKSGEEYFGTQGRVVTKIKGDLNILSLNQGSGKKLEMKIPSDQYFYAKESNRMKIAAAPLVSSYHLASRLGAN